MNKKLFAALTASLMLCGMLTAPVSAAETDVKMGDVNLDGVVDVADAQWILMDYVSLMCRNKGHLTPEQRTIGNVDGKTETSRQYPEIEYVASIEDAYHILRYYCAHLVNPDITLEQEVGRELEADIAYKEFFDRYYIIYDDETKSFVTIEKESESIAA